MNAADIALKIFEIASPILMAAATWAAARLALFIQAKTKNEYLKNALIRLEDAVMSAVKDLQQTVVAAIKEASADGKITDEEKKQIKEKALANLKAHIGVKGLTEIATILGLDSGALDNFLSSKIEAAVYDIRKTDPKPSDPPKPQG